MDVPEDSASDVVRQSKRLVSASRLLIETAQVTAETAAERLARARNTMQTFWLWRELQKRRPDRQ